jgi:EPS-associated MarR family transcriptional regulator
MNARQPIEDPVSWMSHQPCVSRLEKMTNRKDAFKEDVRFKILRIIEAHPDYSQREIASALGISLGGVNYCLKALIEKGFVKVGNFRRSDTKLRYSYALTPSGIAERALLTGRFLQRKKQEYEAIKAEIEAVMNENADRSDDPLPLPSGSES